MINWLQQLFGLHTILDLLTIIAVLLVLVIAALIWLGLSVETQFRHHDRDLRAEVERTNSLITRLLIVSAPNRHKSTGEIT